MVDQKVMQETILAWIMESMGVDEGNSIIGVEENAGGIWITLEDGSVKSMMVFDCEPENEEDDGS